MASSLRSDGGVFERQPLKAFAESLARMSFKQLFPGLPEVVSCTYLAVAVHYSS